MGNDVIFGGGGLKGPAGSTEVGFHVGYVQKADAGDLYGELPLARYEMPVYDMLTDAAGLPILNANGQGQLARNANGNLVPSTVATFGTGSETAPISIGLDGLRGTAENGAAVVPTNAGLFAANHPLVGSDADHTSIVGRDISIGSLHDGQLVVSNIGSDEQVHLKIYLPSVDETGDRELTAGNLDVKSAARARISSWARRVMICCAAASVDRPIRKWIAICRQGWSRLGLIPT